LEERKKREKKSEIGKKGKRKNLFLFLQFGVANPSTSPRVSDYCMFILQEVANF
jgi:hypothetical protein